MKNRPNKSRIPGVEEAPGLEELNLVEFPLAVLADHAPRGTKTLEFKDRIFDKEAGEYLERKCIVSGSDKWGLPNWFDIDIVLALMKMTNDQHRFEHRTVTFSLYRLREVLALPKSHGRYGDRLKTGLLRILGTTVAYENAWRAEDRWTSLDAFHLLDNVRLTNTKDHFNPEVEQHLKWNDVVVESVRRSNTKGLDWDFYTQLKKPSAKRLYRFLDKRFALRSSWSYELESFCPNKLGMAPEQAAWVYRKTLKPGIRELIERKFLAELPEDELFTREGKVAYINFKKSAKRQVRIQTPPAKGKPSGLERELFDRGVTNATQLVAAHAADKIREQIENFDDRNKHGEEKTPGWLRRAIEDDVGFGFRKGYKSKSQREAERRQRAEVARLRQENEAREQEEEFEREAMFQAKRDRVVAYLDSLENDKRTALEEDALQNANSFISGLVREKGRDSIFFWNVVQNHVESILDEEGGQ